MGIFTKAVSTIARNLGFTDPRLAYWSGGGATDAGEYMTVDLAMQLDVVWACVRRNAETIATLPLNLYSFAGGEPKLIATHPLYTVLHNRPNIEMTAVEFWEAMVGCYLLWGNAFASIDRSGGLNSAIVALNPMRPDRTQVRRRPDGALYYIYTINGRSVEYEEEEVLHIKGFSLDGLMGLSPVTQARQNLGTVRAVEKSTGRFFKNGMRPSGFLVSPKESGYLTDPQRELSKGLIEKFSGSGQTGSVPLLEAGWDFKQISMSFDDAQMLMTRSFQVEQICRWFDVPPILIGHSGQTTWGSGIEQIMLGWLTLGLRSHLKRIEQAVWRRLLSAKEQATLYAEFNVDALLRADSSARAIQMASLAQNGLRTRDELRALDNLPPLKAGGDVATVQANLLPIDKLGSDAHLGSNVSRQVPSEQPKEPSTTGSNIPGK